MYVCMSQGLSRGSVGRGFERIRRGEPMEGQSWRRGLLRAQDRHQGMHLHTYIHTFIHTYILKYIS